MFEQWLSLQVACGKCHSFSGHLYERLGDQLGTVDGMTMKRAFCEELVGTCGGQINFAQMSYLDGNVEKDYCDMHVGGSSDQYWSFPFTERK